ncbi:hypothetical protein [Blastococcus xanthinilyticus]|uniref:F0F1-type ATP synthase membrane subunit b/b n=1 Tax=Blastococcus xanthinilyticus TaxID=1564164 RepID=A0A5S5CM66_9ACTN|nr:hypothetical protein [Blastococcus xanthinilyticus]TYP82802.1 hypothetical protein BD833_11838 [Blastococcus xanthinilyticus]
MTHSIDAPFPPPVPATTGATTTTTTTGSPSTKDVAKDEAKHTKDVARDEARNVGQTAAQAGSQVASTAADQARNVADETQRQAKDLLDQGRSQLKDQAVGQQQKAAEGLNAIAQQMRGLADGSSEGAPGPVRDLLQQASGSVESFASMLQNKEPAELLDEVRRFARRKPGMFLLGAAVAGIAAGRLTSGVKAAHTDSGSGSNTGNSGYRGTPINYVDPAPTYSDYSAATTGVATGTGAPLPPPPYGTVPPEGAVVPPATPAGWDDPARRPGGVA